jgi:hypothetical protein
MEEKKKRGNGRGKKSQRKGAKLLLLNGEPAYPGGGCCIVTVPARNAHEDGQHHPDYPSTMRQGARLPTRRVNPASRQAEAGMGDMTMIMMMMMMMRNPVICLPHVHQFMYNIWRHCCAGGADCGLLRVALRCTHSPRVASYGCDVKRGWPT